MSNSEKNIPVHFVSYEPHEHFPDIIATLGHISEAERQSLMSAFNTKTSAPNACIKTLCLEYSDKARFGNVPSFGPRYSSLNLDGLFYYDTKPQCAKTNRKMDNTSKLKYCARNLKDGKCVDEFIRNTLGAILYPQHYAMEKQK
ncbi:MAG: hypothetical protein ACLRFO_00085 [Alphaproteobacteria bacterium]